MTSVMQRPRSIQPVEQHYSQDHPFTHHRSVSSSNTQNHLLSDEFSSSAPTLGTSELEHQLADLQRELLGQPSMTAAPAAGDYGLTTASTSQLAGSSDLSVLESHSGGFGGLETGLVGGLEDGGPSSSMGLLEDPNVLALIGQSSNMDSTDFELSFAAQSLSSQSADGTAGQFSDLNHTSAGTFQFPELPASLLDQAPEYEYVSARGGGCASAVDI
jgi:hypothetical protein